VIRSGDAAAALAASAHVVSGTWRTQRIEHLFLEPEAAVAEPLLDGRLALYTQGQGVFDDRRQVARFLGVPEEQVRVELVPSGGAFGGKEDMSVQAQTALLALVTGRPASMRGTFVADAGVSRRLPGNLSVTATAARAGGTVLGGDSGTTFEIDSLSEPFHVSVGELPDGWAVKEITVNGLSVIDNPAELGPGQQADARIVLTDRVAEVNGTVNATAAGGASVVVFAADMTKWGGRSRYVRVGQADEQGRFRITGLPPGQQYLAIATDYLEDGEHGDPEFLAGMREVAVSFSLDEGETRGVDLGLIER